MLWDERQTPTRKLNKRKTPNDDKWPSKGAPVCTSTINCKLREYTHFNICLPLDTFFEEAVMKSEFISKYGMIKTIPCLQLALHLPGYWSLKKRTRSANQYRKMQLPYFSVY